MPWTAPNFHELNPSENFSRLLRTQDVPPHSQKLARAANDSQRPTLHPITPLKILKVLGHSPLHRNFSHNTSLRPFTQVSAGSTTLELPPKYWKQILSYPGSPHFPIIASSARGGRGNPSGIKWNGLYIASASLMAPILYISFSWNFPFREKS